MAELYKISLLNDAALKLYYRFEETSGDTANDTSAANHDGTASRTNILNNSGGKYGYRAVFVGTSSDFIYTADHADFDSTTSFSVGGWIYRNGSNQNKGIIAKWTGQGGDNSSSFAFIFDPTSANKIALYVNTTSTKNVTTTNVIADTTWTHVVGTYDGSNIKIYVDGAYDTQTGQTGEVVVGTSQIEIGRYSGGNYATGSLDDLFFFKNKVLSSGEVKQLYLDTGGSFLLNFV
jgi:hypothetical protein